MSDYLTWLVERSLGSAPQIEPLIAPLHAPLDELLDEPIESIAEASRPAKPAMQFADDDPVPGEATRRGNVEEVKEGAAADEPARMEKEPHRRSTKPLELRTDSPIEARPDFLHREKPLPQAPSHQSSSAPASPEPARASVPLAPSVPSREERPRLVAQSAIKKRLAAADESRGSPPPPGEIARLPAGPTGIVVHPRIDPLRQTPASSSLSAERPSSKEPPAIHVTIGRVEVRAVTSAPTPPKRAPASPATLRISLEEYLQQRNGGRR